MEENTFNESNINNISETKGFIIGIIATLLLFKIDFITSCAQH